MWRRGRKWQRRALAAPVALVVPAALCMLWALGIRALRWAWGVFCTVFWRPGPTAAIVETVVFGNLSLLWPSALCVQWPVAALADSWQ